MRNMAHFHQSAKLYGGITVDLPPMKNRWIRRLLARDGERLPDVTWRVGKSDRYMMAHVFLPMLLWDRPDLYKRLLAPDGAEVLTAWWEHVREADPAPGALGPSSIAAFTNAENAIGIRITMPPPQTIPEAHVVVVMLQPERRFFVFEKAATEHIRKHRPAVWSIVSSEAQPDVPVEDVLGYCTEWCADGDRFNYGLASCDDDVIPTAVAQRVHVHGPWIRLTAPQEVRWNTTSLRDMPLRPDTSPIPALVLAEAKQIMATAQSAKALEMAVIEAIERYGTAYTEISMHMADVMRMLLAENDLVEAARLVRTWLSFCHAHRGNRSPETRIAFTWDARVRIRQEENERERAVIARQRVVFRDQMFSTVNASLPFATHRDVTISAEALLAELGDHSS